MEPAAILAMLVIILALFFTFTNGFQDGSSVAASAIASRAMTPLQAIFLVAVFEFLGAMFGGSAVAHTIRNITSWPVRLDLLPVLASGLIAAISWNFFTRAIRIPSSSTHALVGGVLGALFAASGTQYIEWGQLSFVHPTGVSKVIITLLFSPIIGFVVGYIALNFFSLLLIKATWRVNQKLKILQWAATALLSFGHGANDPQKSMAIIMLCLHASGWTATADIPLYVRFSTGVAMVLGILSLAPGIVKRVGTGIYKMRNFHGFVAETAAGAVVLGGSLTGGPLSASQVISSTVMGVGAAERFKGVQWLVAKDLLVAWFLTIPCSAMLSFVLHGLALHNLDRLTMR